MRFKKDPRNKEEREADEEVLKMFEAGTFLVLPKITKLKAKAAQYDSGELKTDPIQNFDWYHKWKGFALSRSMLNLFQDNREAFRRMWGKPSFCWHGEFYCYCWLLDIEGKAKILVSTAKEKGSVYEVVIKENGKKIRKDEETIIKFIEHVKKVLSNPKPGLATVYGRRFNTFVFDSVEDTNSWLAENEDYGVLVSIGEEHHVAKLEDEGKAVKPVLGPNVDIHEDRWCPQPKNFSDGIEYA